MASLLQLPRELRDIIYDYYLRCDGGYVYSAETQSLSQADGSRIYYALALTCRQAASELNGLAFQLNAITFSTTYSSTAQNKAGIHHSVVAMLKSCKQTLLKHIAPKLFTPEMAQLVIQDYPQFTGLVETWLMQGDMKTLWEHDNGFGEPMSLWTDFFHRVLDLISEHPAYTDTVKSLEPRLGGVAKGRNPLRLKDAQLEPWLIVDLSELERLSDVVRNDSRTPHYYAKTHYAFSAAAIALQFLASCTDTIRASVRKIILYENEVSVAQPECHGRGFIPLCQANAALRVERHISLWKAVFPVSVLNKREYQWGPLSSLPNNSLRHDRLCAVDVTGSVGKWVMETMALPTLGMPAGSYTLVLDGNPTVEHTSDVFRIVQRDATYQAALDACYASGALPMPSWLDRRRHPGFTYESLPSVVHTLSMTEGSLIRCNFDPGSPCDIEDMLEEHRRWSSEDWKDNWSKHEPHKFQTEHPLPPWHVLRWQHVLPYASFTICSEGRAICVVGALDQSQIISMEIMSHFNLHIFP